MMAALCRAGRALLDLCGRGELFLVARPHAITGCFWLLGPVGIWRNIYKRSDQTQQRLLFWSIRSLAQKGHQIDMGKPTARWAVWLMDNEGPTISRLAG